MRFREVLKNLMDEKNIKVHELATATGYSAAFIYDLLKGSRRFNEETEEKFCEYFGITKTYVKKTA